MSNVLQTPTNKVSPDRTKSNPKAATTAACPAHLPPKCCLADVTSGSIHFTIWQGNTTALSESEKVILVKLGGKQLKALYANAVIMLCPELGGIFYLLTFLLHLSISILLFCGKVI